MTGLLDWPLAPVVCSTSSAPKRKYPHTLEMIQASPGGAWVGVHSALANRLVEELLAKRLLPQLGEWVEVKREVAYGDRGSRVDLVLTRATGRRVYVEVKSVTLAEPYSQSNPPCDAAAAAADVAASSPAAAAGAAAAATSAAAAAPAAAAAGTSAAAAGAAATPGRRIALFPDTVSERAQRHVRDLEDAVQGGHEAACVFVIQRGDCDVFAPCAAKDPLYAQLLRQAARNGVQVLALRTSLLPPSPPPPLPPAGGGGDGSGGGDGGGGGEAQHAAHVRYLGPAEVDLEYGGADAGGDGVGGGGGGAGGAGGRGSRGGRAARGKKAEAPHGGGSGGGASDGVGRAGAGGAAAAAGAASGEGPGGAPAAGTRGARRKRARG
ncbi:Sugar fermentation stimulation [Tetrabaena socialis]|uniref:Sugar fermentation stimulation n=1 Tax=Tetrabaena socialis TaxID=47790 RepID=A0A2J8ADT3_9CHLO|nr:Sugar fermentation stimulation [Tetrabaena socialis]|eukprot:PNH10688.1 Sugar fermentation stimulation [Tetrabaena socialis]